MRGFPFGHRLVSTAQPMTSVRESSSLSAPAVPAHPGHVPILESGGPGSLLALLYGLRRLISPALGLVMQESRQKWGWGA